MPDDLAALRSALPAFLAARHIEIDAGGHLPCPNAAAHPDGPGFAQLSDAGVTCTEEGTTWDVFDLAGLLDGVACTRSTFPARIQSVKDTLALAPSKPMAELTDGELAQVKTKSRKGARAARQAADLDRDWPFRILGRADDNLIHFLGRGGHHYGYDGGTLSKNRLMELAPLSWWLAQFPGARGSFQVDAATDAVLSVAATRGFDIASLRGRGAWREPDGRLCFHDGENTLGEPDPLRIYQRKAAWGMGLEGEAAGAEVREAMRHAAKHLSFETEADSARLLAWSAISPFCGALPWRPAGFLTGPSKSGKSTILQHVVNRLAMPLPVSGSSTEAYIRQATGNDARAVVIDEAEAMDDEGRRHIQGILALMRQSTSDDAPLIGKGTTTGKPLSFNTRNMYLFSAISQGVERQADANRLFVCDLVRPDNDWHTIKFDLAKAWTMANCAGVRAHTWRMLSAIIDGAELMADAVQEAAGFDTRYALLEGVLWSAFWWVWMDREPSAEELRDWLARVYATKSIEQAPDDADVLLSKILQQDVALHGAASERYTLGALLRAMANDTGEGHSEIQPERVRSTLRQYGLWVLQRGGEREGCVAVPIDRVQIARIVSQPQYHKVLRRHVMCVSKSHPVADGAGGQARCMLFSPAVLGGEPPKEMDP